MPACRHASHLFLLPPPSPLRCSCSREVSLASLFALPVEGISGMYGCKRDLDFENGYRVVAGMFLHCLLT